MAITKELFGQTKKGKTAYRYTLTNANGMKAVVSDFGAALISIFVPNADGRLVDVVLGYDSPEKYEDSTTFFGATIGRNANRIAGASFTLDGIEYSLAVNDGENNLHSNPDGYQIRLWEAEIEEDSICFSLFSPDGDQGYPGNLDVSVTYTLTDENGLMICYRAVGDQNTIVNMTNHSYFNLSGHDFGTAMEQSVWIDADYFTESDAKLIPTGKLIPVENTPMDFRVCHPIGERIDENYEALLLGGGYDHNWVLKNQGECELVARLVDEKAGMEMNVYTDLPGLQFYAGNFIEEEQGKNNAVYHRRDGVCFETQYFPDAVHHKNFLSPVLAATEEYETITVYQFASTEQKPDQSMFENI